MSKVNVMPLSGFRDFGQREQAHRLWLIGCALEVYRRFGYFPIETPLLERDEILQGQYGDEGDSLRYRFKDNGGRSVGLRYDLTVPFARFVAAKLPKSEIRLPYRRSQVGPVLRAESAQIQAGRFREFYQADFDIAGSGNPAADAEVVVVSEAMLLELGVSDFKIYINSRRVLDGILRSCGVADSTASTAALIALDKLEKAGREAVMAELADKAGIVDPDVLLAIVEAPFSPEDLAVHLAGDEEGLAGLANLTQITDLARGGMINPGRLTVSLSLARGLAYYTGFVIETVVTGAEGFGSVLSGGRYDQTIGTFMKDSIPAVGASLGVDRCLTVLEALGALPPEAGLADVAVLSFDAQANEAFALASRLRQQGVSTVLLPGEMKSVGRMFSYASSVARWAILLGGAEVEGDFFNLKNLKTQEQHRIGLLPEAVALIRAA